MTDPRDKVFGLLGLAADKIVPLNPPDYKISTAEVYTRLAQTYIETYPNLSMLKLLLVSECPPGGPQWSTFTIMGTGLDCL